MKSGVVISDAMDKSITVEVMRTVKDPVFGKYVRLKSKFMAHDEKNECKVGDQVLIRECRPLSKRKRWTVESILQKRAE
jgi:small subunit ribosomal protein S17